jgi:hypothetical protein
MVGSGSGHSWTLPPGRPTEGPEHQGQHFSVWVQVHMCMYLRLMGLQLLDNGPLSPGCHTMAASLPSPHLPFSGPRKGTGMRNSVAGFVTYWSGVPSQSRWEQ